MKSAALFDIAGISNENDEWYTPSWMFAALSIEFDLDPEWRTRFSRANFWVCAQRYGARLLKPCLRIPRG